ncbi:hypothetical protein P4502_18995 [Peribacillus frigoritolerans]|nr:hypothetical protein [Peribacillus frigoritolerans]MED3711290.1 hypothetical protein [Peribacillus frigoritolerans]
MTNVEYLGCHLAAPFVYATKGKLVAQAIEHFSVMGNAFYFCLINV